MLLEAGLVKESNAKKDEPVWRRDEQSGRAFALKLSAPGRKAIVANHDDAVKRPADSVRSSLTTTNQTDSSSISAHGPASEMMRGDEVAIAAAPLIAPRAGSKIAGVIARLSQPNGATIDELIGATGWLPHTTRAALTGLRKRGYTLRLDRSSRAQGSIYRLTTDSRIEQAHHAFSAKEEGGRQEADRGDQKCEGGSREDETGSAATRAINMSSQAEYPGKRRSRKAS